MTTKFSYGSLGDGMFLINSILGATPYPYTPQLSKLEACVPSKPSYLPAALLEITNPLVSSIWEQELKDHPDRQFAAYMVNGIKQGFRVGFDHNKHLASCSSNMVSALDHPDVVNDYLQQELLLVVIPDSQLPYIHCHISPFGVIPKRSKLG